MLFEHLAASCVLLFRLSWWQKPNHAKRIQKEKTQQVCSYDHQALGLQKSTLSVPVRRRKKGALLRLKPFSKMVSMTNRLYCFSIDVAKFERPKKEENHVKYMTRILLALLQMALFIAVTPKAMPPL